MMFNLKFSDECSYSVEVGTLISAVRFFPTGTLIRGGTLISAVRVFPTGALIRGGTLNRIPIVDLVQILWMVVLSHPIICCLGVPLIIFHI